MANMKLKDLNQNSTVADFIAYFETIPDTNWCVNMFIADDGRKCARGHLGVGNCYHPGEADDRLMELAPDIVYANNGALGYEKTGRLDPGPIEESPRIKARVIKYLKSLL